MSAGRPTKYDESLANDAFSMLKEGKSITQVAVSFGVNRDTVYEWAKVHEEFSDALSRGKEASQAHWEGELVEMMRDPKVNAPLVKLYFANRFGWHDKVSQDTTVRGHFTISDEPLELDEWDDKYSGE